MPTITSLSNNEWRHWTVSVRSIIKMWESQSKNVSVEEPSKLKSVSSNTPTVGKKSKKVGADASAAKQVKSQQKGVQSSESEAEDIQELIKLLAFWPSSRKLAKKSSNGAEQERYVSVPASHETTNAGLVGVRRSESALPDKFHGKNQEATTSAKRPTRPDHRKVFDVSRHDCLHFSSNHMLVNFERTKRGVPPLHRSVDLDELAEVIADLAVRCPRWSRPLLPHNFYCPFEFNMIHGYSIRSIHKFMMDRKGRKERNRILDPKFKLFGMATSTKISGGRMFLVQIYSCGNGCIEI